MASVSPTSSIWPHSSRVGVTTRAVGCAFLPSTIIGALMFCRIGSTKAAVLPVPVWAQPTTSRPASTRGMACSWIGVGVHVAHGGDAGEQLAFEAERGERRDLDLGGRPGGLLDVLALLVALVDALAAAVTAVAAVALAAALAAAVVAARAVVRRPRLSPCSPERSLRSGVAAGAAGAGAPE